MKNMFSTIPRLTLALALSTSAIAILSIPAFAQAAGSAGNGQALEIGPPLINLRADPGQTVKATISLRDVSDNPLVVSNELNDFTAAGEDGTPQLLLNNSKPGANSIIPWISPLPQFTLTPKQIQTLNLTVKIPGNASPGGYYGVIRFTGTPPGLKGSGVALSASIGTLVFIRVNGDVKENLSIDNFTANGENGKPNWLFESAPINLEVRLKNNGNMFEAPTGSVTVTDMFGKTVGTLGYNKQVPPGYVLPNSVRMFTRAVDTSLIGNKFLFGRYTAKLSMTYGETPQTVTSMISFWVIPYRLIATIIIGLVALFALFRIWLRRYRQRLLNQSRGGRRR